MKKFLIFLFAICLTQIVLGQNLVPNPSFEDTVMCPYGSNQVSVATGWSSYRNTPEYYHKCCTYGCNVPNTPSGFQYAASGDAFCGLYTFHYLSTDFREYIGSQLYTPLIINQKYYVSIKANLTNEIQCATNKLGVLFSTVPYSNSNPIPINNFAHIFNSYIVSDTASWTIISSSFIADSMYKYIVIGNFFSDTNTNTILFSTNDCVSYYFIDDICVSIDSTTCNSNSSLEETNNQRPFNIFPNPTKDLINIELNYCSFANIEIFNFIGKSILKQSIFTKNLSINLTSFSEGIYFIQLTQDNKKFYRKTFTQKLIILK